MATKNKVRAKQHVAVMHPDFGVMVVPRMADYYDSDDPLVREYPWLFGTDDDLAALAAGGDTPVETATAAPGEKRTTRKPAARKKTGE